jgi:hypothetical protein
MILGEIIKGKDFLGIPIGEVGPKGQYRMVVLEGDSPCRVFVSNFDAFNYLSGRGRIDRAYKLVGNEMVNLAGRPCYEIMAISRTVPGSQDSSSYGGGLLDRIENSLESHITEVSRIMSDLRPLFAPVDLMGEDSNVLYGSASSVVDKFYVHDPDKSRTLDENPDQNLNFNEALARRGIDPEDFSV